MGKVIHQKVHSFGFKIRTKSAVFSGEKGEVICMELQTTKVLS
jgi:hypothetical protein